MSKTKEEKKIQLTGWFSDEPRTLQYNIDIKNESSIEFQQGYEKMNFEEQDVDEIIEFLKGFKKRIQEMKDAITIAPGTKFKVIKGRLIRFAGRAFQMNDGAEIEVIRLSEVQPKWGTRFDVIIGGTKGTVTKTTFDTWMSNERLEKIETL